MVGVSNSGVSGMQREYDWDDVEPAVAVLESIAAFEHGDAGDPASALNPPLQSHVDVDALNAIVREGSMSHLALRIDDYRVQIHGECVDISRAER